jgi:hypothetical protein
LSNPTTIKAIAVFAVAAAGLSTISTPKTFAASHAAATGS